MNKSQILWICITALMILVLESICCPVSVQPGVEQVEALFRRRTWRATPDLWQSWCVHTSRVPTAQNQCKKGWLSPKLFCKLHWFSAGLTVRSLQTVFSSGVSVWRWVWGFFCFTLDGVGTKVPGRCPCFRHWCKCHLWGVLWHQRVMLILLWY